MEHTHRFLFPPPNGLETKTGLCACGETRTGLSYWDESGVTHLRRKPKAMKDEEPTE